MLPPSCILTFHWTETNIMQMVKLKVSDALLSLLSALALKHTRDGKRWTRLPHFDVIINFSLIFLFSWISQDVLSNTTIVLFKSLDKVYVFVICWCIMLHALWASDCYKPWAVWDTRTTSRGELMHPLCAVCLVRMKITVPHTENHWSEHAL